MLTILLQPDSAVPLYRQICRSIQEKIADGTLQPGEKLPSKRALAAHLQISMITVQTAYEQLMAEGFLTAKPRAGYFVDADAQLLVHRPQDSTEPVSVSLPQPPSDQIIFSTAGVDLNQFPFSTWAKLSRQVLSTKQETLLQATPAMGLYALRQAISRHLREFRDISASPEQILVGAGTEYLLGLLVQLLGASRQYAVEDPGYPRGKQTLKSNGASVVAVPLDNSGIRIQALEQSGASVALVTPSHQFPTGMVMPIRRRAELLEWVASQPERYLIEDDYDNELRFHGKPLPSLYRLDVEQGHVIYMNTFARTLAPSLRIGYMVLPEQLAQRFSNELAFYSSTVPSFEQYTLVSFLQEGYFERHLHRMKKLYAQRQKQFKAAILSHPLSQHLRICGEEAGLHFLMEVQLPCTEQALVDAAAQVHVTITGISNFYENRMRRKGAFPCVVLGYACLSDQEIETGVKRLLDAWEQFEKTAAERYETGS